MSDVGDAKPAVDVPGCGSCLVTGLVLTILIGLLLFSLFAVWLRFSGALKVG
ncbi:MAG TPA: hypothetical protein VGP63_12515 [Planctomycetaceae bacterium]|jgi:hypothetical protein|nr:hypothetical protein [Planctomycetaceae bacterium]